MDSNLYLYTRSTPVSLVDPLGLNPDACDAIKAAGDDDGDLGGVVCDNGNIHSCVWTDNLPDSWDNSEIISCIRIHENTHHDDIVCPDCGISRPDFKDEADPDAEECNAYMAEYDCAGDAQLRCWASYSPGSAECAGLDDYFDDVVAGYGDNCDEPPDSGP